MADETAPAEPGEATPEPAQPDKGDTTDWKAEAEKWRAAARKHEDRSKQNQQAVAELEKLRQASMTDQEKAIDAAKAEGRQQTLAELGGRLVSAEIRAAAAGRFDDDRMAVVLQGANHSAFLQPDGTVDTTSVKAWVDAIAPQASPQPAGFPPMPDLGQGARPGQYALGDDNALLRDVKTKLGIG